MARIVPTTSFSLADSISTDPLAPGASMAAAPARSRTFGVMSEMPARAPVKSSCRPVTT
ncbi:hypothetical protein A6302_03410 [Methylobrevis pamukkalensis]|uniref:Uncharacterized protein n=1 Tax=Methylobrevis pamukkalensis TaxID=1439726 RepID=A0A1E3GYZ9_9HYPH|nr:hypothetical protein A6302_03410 [Methylobrevis pamukkalensis]